MTRRVDTKERTVGQDTPGFAMGSGSEDGKSSYWWVNDTAIGGSQVIYTVNFPKKKIQFAWASISEPGPHYGDAFFEVLSVENSMTSVRVLFQCRNFTRWRDEGVVVDWGSDLEFSISLHIREF